MNATLLFDGFSKLKPHKTILNNLLAHLYDEFFKKFLYCYVLVFYEGLLNETYFLVEFLHFPVNYLSIIFSGFPDSIACFSVNIFSASFYLQGHPPFNIKRFDAVICMAMSFANSWNSFVLATKSVSQLISTMVPTFAPVWI